jgi:hypothetical protein
MLLYRRSIQGLSVWTTSHTLNVEDSRYVWNDSVPSACWACSTATNVTIMSLWVESCHSWMSQPGLECTLETRRSSCYQIFPLALRYSVLACDRIGILCRPSFCKWRPLHAAFRSLPTPQDTPAGSFRPESLAKAIERLTQQYSRSRGVRRQNFSDIFSYGESTGKI